MGVREILACIDGPRVQPLRQTRSELVAQGRVGPLGPLDSKHSVCRGPSRHVVPKAAWGAIWGGIHVLSKHS